MKNVRVVIFAYYIAAGGAVTIAAVVVIARGINGFDEFSTNVVLAALVGSFWGLSVSCFRFGIRDMNHEAPFVAFSSAGFGAIGAVWHILGPTIDPRVILAFFALSIIVANSCVIFGTLKSKRINRGSHHG